jgi:tRNA (cytidine/uridine-2'-O-)-methyltransferase
MINLVLYQPDIPQNLGAVLRLSACLGCAVHVVEPCGFPFDHQKMRRVGMDYVDKATLVRHINWAAFQEYRAANPGKLYLLETDGTKTYTDMAFTQSDYVVLGRESAGTPRELYAQMDATITIPMRPGSRSINVAMSAGLLVGEACRQQNWTFE